MSGSPSWALGRLIWSDVGLDESGLDDGGARPVAKWWSFSRCALRFATCRYLLRGRELTTTIFHALKDFSANDLNDLVNAIKLKVELY